MPKTWTIDGVNYVEAKRPPTEGDLIVPADGSSYVGVVTYVSKAEDTVRHRCTRTGCEYEKSYFGFFCRYIILVAE